MPILERLHEPESTINLQALREVFQRRRWVIFGAGGILFCASVATATLWPPTYKSMATILIEEQEVPA